MNADSSGNLFFVVSPDRWNLRAAVGQNSGLSFSWAYLGQSIAAFHRARDYFEDHGAWLATTDRFHRVAEDLRKPFLAYLYGLGLEIGSLHWWISSLSFRSGFSSKSFHQACYLKVALDLVDSWAGPGPLILVVSDSPVWRALKNNSPQEDGKEVRFLVSRPSAASRAVRYALKMLAHRGWFLFREIYRWLQSRMMIRRPPTLAEPVTLIVSYATQANLSNARPFHESYFGNLSTQLENAGSSVAISPMLLKEVPYHEALTRFRDVPLPVLVPHRYLTLLDLVRAAVRSCNKLPLPDPLPRFCGLDIEPLLQEELRGFRVTNWAADVLLVAALVRRWADTGLTFERIIYVYENQPWERALCWAARRYMPGTVLVGYQHARVPRFLLNLYFAPGGEIAAPLPDRVVTVGRHTARLLTNDGYGPIQVRVAGALQMQGFLESRPDRNGSNMAPSEPVVLVAPSSGLEEAAELVDMAVHLFDRDEGVKVVVKCHPQMTYHQASGLAAADLPGHVQVSDQPIIELMQESAVMVYSGSTVCIQALALGLPLIHVRPQFDFDLDPLEAVPDARPEVTGLEELRQKVRWMLQHREEYISQHQESWSQLVEEIYGPVTEDTVHAFID